MLPSEKLEQIESELIALEKEEEVSVLWACESGSRAWGFESKDSDYDVRFIYLRRTGAYLRASPLRDVIEKPISDDLDISGWDLPKALGLFRKSNPPLFEWLQSPVVYREHTDFSRVISSLIPEYFSPVGCMHHYMSMAERNRRGYLDEDKIKLKRYFYMLRPVLACMWIDRGLGVPPIEFRKLLEELVSDVELKSEIEQLIERKKEGEELDLSPPIPLLSDFINDQMKRFTEATKETQFTKAWEPLDDLFRRMLILVNGEGL